MNNLSLGIGGHRTNRSCDNASKLTRCCEVPGLFLDKKACWLLRVRTYPFVLQGMHVRRLASIHSFIQKLFQDLYGHFNQK